VLIIFILYLAVISLGIISSIFYLIQLRKSEAKLPEAWRNIATPKKFRLSVRLLTIFLALVLINQITLNHLANHHIDNSLAFSLCFTFIPIPLFAFFYIHTQSKWKRYSYIVLHAILVASLFYGGYYHPFSLPNTSISLILNSVFFLIALLNLTDLLIYSKTDHFKFKLKINLVVLIFSLLASILSTLHWSDISSGHSINVASFLLQNINMLLFYFLFVFVFVSESIQLSRRG
jgi:hypothetical protein